MIKMADLWRVTRRNIGLPEVFVLLCAVFGLLFVVKTPLLWGSDETFHTMRVYQIADHHLFAQHLGDSRTAGGYGGKIPGNLYGLVLNVNHDQFDNDAGMVPYGKKNVDDPGLYKVIGAERIDGGPPVTYAFPNTAPYSPVPYVPALTGMVVAKHYNFTIHATVMLMRLLGLAAYILVVWYALRLLGRSTFRWMLFVVALLPMAVFQAAIISVDGLTIGVCLLFFALILRAIGEGGGTLSTRNKALLVLTVAALPLLKPGYVFLSALLLCIPARSIGSRRQARLFVALTLLLAGGLFVAWTLATRDIASAVAFIKPGTGAENINVSGQMAYILHHPLGYATTVIRNTLLNDNHYYLEMIGEFGVNAVPTSGLVMVFETLALLVSVVLAKPAARHAKAVPYVFWGVALLSGLLIITTLYMTYSAIGAPEISGIQGRYLTPLIPFALAGTAFLVKDRLALSRPGGRAAYYGGKLIILLVVASLILSFIKYTYVTG